MRRRIKFPLQGALSSISHLACSSRRNVSGGGPGCDRAGRSYLPASRARRPFKAEADPGAGPYTSGHHSRPGARRPSISRAFETTTGLSHNQAHHMVSLSRGCDPAFGRCSKGARRGRPRLFLHRRAICRVVRVQPTRIHFGRRCLRRATPGGREFYNIHPRASMLPRAPFHDKRVVP